MAFRLYYKVVSIHAPREGCDLVEMLSDVDTMSFNSRTPGGVRPSIPAFTFKMLFVSIHAPREGCDMREQNDFAERMWFQFTHPGRGATGRATLLRR